MRWTYPWIRRGDQVLGEIAQDRLGEDRQAPRRPGGRPGTWDTAPCGATGSRSASQTCDSRTRNRRTDHRSDRLIPYGLPFCRHQRTSPGAGLRLWGVLAVVLKWSLLPRFPGGTGVSALPADIDSNVVFGLGRRVRSAGS